MLASPSLGSRNVLRAWQENSPGSLMLCPGMKCPLKRTHTHTRFINSFQTNQHQDVLSGSVANPLLKPGFEPLLQTISWTLPFKGDHCWALAKKHVCPTLQCDKTHAKIPHRLPKGKPFYPICLVNLLPREITPTGVETCPLASAPKAILANLIRDRTHNLLPCQKMAQKSQT